MTPRESLELAGGTGEITDEDRRAFKRAELRQMQRLMGEMAASDPDDESPPPPRRSGCLSVLPWLALLLAIALGIAPSPAPSSVSKLPSTVSGLSGAPHRALNGRMSDEEPGRPATSTRLVSGAPTPTGSVSFLVTATATWCAPTPKQCQSWGGNAKLGAVNSFRDGDEPYLVRVSRGRRQVTVLVVSYCACLGTEHAIDLSPAAFKVLAPLSRGRIDVVLEWPVPELPRTDSDLRMQAEVRDDEVYR